MNLKRRHVFALVCLVAVLVVSAISVEEFLSKQNVEDNEYRFLVESLLKDAITEVEKIKGVSFPWQVGVEVVTINWAKENWGRRYANADKENILREERIQKALFIIPENSSLYEAQIEWTGSFVAAVWQGKIYVVKEYFNPSDKFGSKKTLIHELTHILQGKYGIPERPTYDGVKARSALIEGDACLMEEIYSNRNNHLGFIAERANMQNSLMLLLKPQFAGHSASLPDSVSRLNYFPYEYGLKFVRTLHADGGWTAVNQSYGNPPSTTEQVIHPEKYAIGEKAQETKEPNITEKDWSRIKNERFGEYFILVMLSNWIPQNDAEKAAEGWGGDNFTYYERGNEYLLTWNITWDSIEDASEFYTSFQQMMNETGAQNVAQNNWQAYGRYLSITRKGTSTLIVSSTNANTLNNIVAYAQQVQSYKTTSYDEAAFIQEAKAHQ
jgi:hypothetical protein